MKIILNRVEGPVTRDKWAECTSFEAAHEILNEWSNSAPDNGSYDKVEFEVILSPENTYWGRYYLQHKIEITLLDHMELAIIRAKETGFFPKDNTDYWYHKVQEWKKGEEL